jgi:HEAT repeat protein
MGDPDDDRRAKKKKRDDDDDEGAADPETGSEAPDEVSSVESGDVVKSEKRKWTLSEVIAALRARPRLLPDGTVYVNEKVLKALSKVGARAMPAVLEVLEDTRWTARWAALAAAQRIALRDDGVDVEAALPKLAAALDDEKARVRAKAVEAVAALRRARDEVLPVLIRALGDQNAEVSRLAVMHILELGVEPAELTERLVEVLTTKRSVYLRVGALLCLLHLGKAAKPAVPYLIEALEDPAAEVREYANLALTAIRTPSMRLQVIRTASMRLKAVEEPLAKKAKVEAKGDDEEEEFEEQSEEEKKAKKPLVRRRKKRPFGR